MRCPQGAWTKSRGNTQLYKRWCAKEESQRPSQKCWCLNSVQRDVRNLSVRSNREHGCHQKEERAWVKAERMAVCLLIWSTKWLRKPLANKRNIRGETGIYVRSSVSFLCIIATITVIITIIKPCLPNPLPFNSFSRLIKPWWPF